jgi:nucleoid DNA-binding protein
MSEKISIQDLAVLLSEKADIPPKNAETLVKECFNIMQEALVEDKLLKINNLGTFKLVLVEDYESIDVSTGEKIVIPAHYKVIFLPDIALAEMVNAPYNSFEIIEIEEDDISDDDNDDVSEPEIEDEPESEDEPEEIKTIYKEPECPIEQEEEQPAYFEQYDNEYKPVKRQHVFRGIFVLIVVGFILCFTGYYFYPMIRSGIRGYSAPDSVVIFSYKANHLSGLDSLKMKSSPIDSVAIQVANSAKVTTDSDRLKVKSSPADSVVIQVAKSAKVKTNSDKLKVKSSSVDSVAIQVVDKAKVKANDNQPSKTFVNKKHKILDGERINTIALREYGHKVFWVYIYEENRNIIGNPDLIQPGITIYIPPAEKYGIDKNNPESVNKALKLTKKYKP